MKHTYNPPMKRTYSLGNVTHIMVGQAKLPVRQSWDKTGHVLVTADARFVPPTSMGLAFQKWPAKIKGADAAFLVKTDGLPLVRGTRACS